MVRERCRVKGCESRRVKGVSFFRIPGVITNQGDKVRELSYVRRRQWLKNLDISDVESNSFQICYKHFHSGKPANVMDFSHPDWAPCKHLGADKVPINMDRYNRRIERQIKKSQCITALKGKQEALQATYQEPLLPTDDNSSLVIASECNSLAGTFKASTQKPEESCNSTIVLKELSSVTTSQHQETNNPTELIQEPIGFSDKGNTCMEKNSDNIIEFLRKQNTKLVRENRYLRKYYDRMKAKALAIQQKIDQFNEEKYFVKTLVKNDHKLRLYTGLQSADLFECIRNYIKPYLNTSTSFHLTKEDKIFLTLWKLKTNLPDEMIADRFHISRSVVNKIIAQTIEVLNLTLCKACIVWPTIETVKLSMPMIFREHFPNCIVIIDCFEIFIDRPCNLQERSATYSQYKSHNTAKYLIGITPQGTVSFISKGFGGHVSDKQIVLDSGILTLINPGDLVLADRGFLVHEAIALRGAQLKTPAFKEPKTDTPPRTGRVSNIGQCEDTCGACDWQHPKKVSHHESLSSPWAHESMR